MSFSEIAGIVATAVLSVGGAGAIILGLSNWLGRFWAQHLMQKDRAAHERALEQLRTELGKSVHVHRLQFETEFTAYREIWADLIVARSRVLALRPIMDYISPEQSAEERREARVREFSESYHNFAKKLEQSRPFFAEDVWEPLRELAIMMQHESIDYQHRSRDDSEYWNEAKRNSEKILAQVDEVCTAIRARLTTLAVVE